MAAAFPIPLTAAQIGTYFVGQYYHVLVQQPEIVHQFYSDASTMLRIDGHTRETATAMLQIHTLVMSVNFVGVEIKTINSLESWNGGLLVIVSGSVQQKNFSGNRKFVQTFFLAPQETGLFILNDIFHLVEEEEEQIHHHHPTVLLAPPNNLNASTTSQESVVPSYGLGRGEVQEARDFAPPEAMRENGCPVVVDNYTLKGRSEQVTETENFHEDSVVRAEEPNSEATQNAAVNVVVQDRASTLVDEAAAGERQKHTYASILRVAKGQAPPPSVAAISKNIPPPPLPASEWDQPPEPSNHQRLASPNTYERSGVETAHEVVSGVEDDEGEVKSVYVRNLPSTVSEPEIEEEFSKFGRIRPDGVVIRGRKDLGDCYAFVEFEEIAGVENAVKAATAQIAGRQVYIEERRPNSNVPSRGKGRGGRGGGRGSYYRNEAPRGRFGSPRTFGRGDGGGGDRDYNNNNNNNRSRRNNGFHRSNPRQASSNQQAASRSGGQNMQVL